MANNVLSKIIDNKRMEVAERKLKRPLKSIKKNLQASRRDFYAALSNEGSNFIFECKKASPSKGLLREIFDLPEIISSYRLYASAISVLTDYQYFKGSFEHLETVSQSVEQPVLCKDFFIDVYQVYEARSHGADAILLMLSVLNDKTYQKLHEVANKLNLDVLTEVHDSAELKRALKLNAKIIGINNRNLKDLTIDLSTTEVLLQEVSRKDRNGRIFISESGISDHSDVLRLSPLVNGFLVGSSLMEKDDLRQQCKSLIYGNIKICGLTDNKTALCAERLGANYGGLIFHPASPRNVELTTAKKIIKGVKMFFVGVFVDEPIENLIAIATQLALKIIQLHGKESIEYIKKIKSKLPTCQVWKAVSAKNVTQVEQSAKAYLPWVDKLLLDTYSPDRTGGVGTAFDWGLMAKLPPERIVVAGGINLSNISRAQQLQTFAVDINSGVEESPGLKSEKMMQALFKQITSRSFGDQTL